MAIPGGGQFSTPEGFRSGNFAPFPFNPTDFTLVYKGHKPTLSGQPRFDDAIAVGRVSVAGSPGDLALAAANAFRDAEWRYSALESLRSGDGRVLSHGDDLTADNRNGNRHGELGSPNAATTLVWRATVTRPGWFRARQREATILAGLSADGTVSIAVFILGGPEEAAALHAEIAASITG